MQKIVLIAAAVSSGLMAGLFFAWSVSVMPGLAKLADREFCGAMQSMNRAIQNPVFFLVFFGAALALPLAAVLHYQKPLSLAFWFLAAAVVLYLVGVMGVTIFGNVPLNNILDAFNLPAASVQETAAQRASFEAPWTTLNWVRTASSALALVFTILACLYRDDVL